MKITARAFALVAATLAVTSSMACATDTPPPADENTARIRIDREAGPGTKDLFGNTVTQLEDVDPDTVVAWAGWVGADDVAVITSGPIAAEQMVIGGYETAAVDVPMGTPPEDAIVDGEALGFVLIIGKDVEVPVEGSLGGFGSDVELDVRPPLFIADLSDEDRDNGYHEGLNTEGADSLQHTRDFASAAVRDGIANGELRHDLDPEAAAEMLVAALWGLGFYAGFVGGQSRLAAITDEFIRLLDGGPWAPTG